MGFFDKKIKNETTNVDATTTTTNTDNRIGGDDSIFGGNQSVVVGDGGGDINLTTTDFGAIDAAIKANISVSDGAFDFATDANKRTIDFAGDALDRSFDSVDDAYDLTGDVIEANNKQFKFVAEQSAQQFDRSLAFAAQANKSENQQFLESGLGFLKTGGMLIFGGVAVFLYFNKKG